MINKENYKSTSCFEMLTLINSKLKIMKKMVILLMGLLLLSCGKTKEEGKVENKSGDGYQIGVIQIVDHPALNTAKEGFMEAFKEAGIAVNYDEKIANGEIPTANLIAQKFVEDSKDLILAIATPTAQAAANVTEEIPIVVTAVTDPDGAGLKKPNVTGTSDRADIIKQLELLDKLGKKVKTVGVIYNSSEQNSHVQAQELIAAAKQKGYATQEVSVTSPNELAPALDTILSKVDVLYLPSDNLMASSMSLVTEKANEAKVVTIAGEEHMVKNGALITSGIDYFALGKRAGQMAIEILKNGKKPSDIPFETQKDLKITINGKTAKALGIEIPEQLKKESSIVE